MELRTAVDRDGLRYVMAAGYGAITLYRLPKGWREGDAVPQTHVGWMAGDTTHALVLKDLDGDGWVDAVLGRRAGEQNVWVVFGPLWQQFQAMEKRQYVLK
jgi:hypothetical protein